MTWEQFIKYLTESDGSGGRVLKVSDTINDNSDIYTSSDPSGGRVIKVTMVGGGASPMGSRLVSFLSRQGALSLISLLLILLGLMSLVALLVHILLR